MLTSNKYCIGGTRDHTLIPGYVLNYSRIDLETCTNLANEVVTVEFYSSYNPGPIDFKTTLCVMLHVLVSVTQLSYEYVE